MREVSRFEFGIYALSLPWGHGFGERPPIGAWMSDDDLSLGVLTKLRHGEDFACMVMRRRVDAVWTVTMQQGGFASRAEAEAALGPHLESGIPREPIRPGEMARPALSDLEGRTPSSVFASLARPSHVQAAWALNQLYLAMPQPDRNWVGDCQTANFHTRLWEAHLLACFREQGHLVTQPHASPDFRIENRGGDVAWVEAVTANPPNPYDHAASRPAEPPSERQQLFFGRAAERFAKTIGNKRAKRYDQLDHVRRQPFALAIADFQEPGSMMWSREGLIGYLYGQGAEVREVDGRRFGVSTTAKTLMGPSSFPAGLFTNREAEELSAVIFSNACAISKLYRVPITGMGALKEYRYTRVGEFFDKAPEALEGIPFCLDITSDEYRGLWPEGHEPWAAELEVFHNPFAQYPMSLTLLPEATHWFTLDGELHGRGHYKTSILWSRTFVQDTDMPPITLDRLRNGRVLGEEQPD